MDAIMTGSVPPVALGGLLTALQTKGVSGEELRGLADAMVDHAVDLAGPEEAVDIVGTGGDLANTVNISTMASMVVASTGVPVVKHGNRASTSKSGSADVLEALGVSLDLEPSDVEAVLHEVGITFCFAQVFHPSMRHAVEARRGVGVPTVFNLLGPLTNPSRPSATAVGVADASMAPVVADVFAGRGTSALVFRGRDGLDEITVGDCSDVWEVRGSRVVRHELDPRALLGVHRSPLEALRGGTAAENADVARRLFDGETGPVRDAVLVNAAAAICAARARDLQAPGTFEERFAEAHRAAEEALDSGAPRRVLMAWCEATAGR